MSRMRGATPPLHQYVFMTWCLVKAQGQLYLLLTSHKRPPLDLILSHMNPAHTLFKAYCNIIFLSIARSSQSSLQFSFPD